MLQLDNQTQLPCHFTIVPDASGVDSVCVTVRATFAVDEDGVTLHPDPPPVQLEDVYRGEPGESSLAMASDFALEKPAADVLLVGHAHAPGGKPTTAVDVGLQVGPLKKYVHVVGDRTWRDGPLGAQPTSPRPFETLPLVYERAYGGRDASKNEKRVGADPKNPVGTGYLLRGGQNVVDGMPLANLEEPGQSIRKPRDRYPPVGYGPICGHWEPRCRHAGTYDETWEKERAPFLPDDFDSRFFNCAPTDQVLDGCIAGGEEVRLLNLTPHGKLHFALPRLDVRCDVMIAGQNMPVALRCDTLILEPDHLRFSLVWRGLQSCDKQVLEVNQVRIRCEQAPSIGGSPS